MIREELAAEIARRAPWYQRISIPEYGMTTTDDPSNAMIDAAWDNKIDGIELTAAAILRPTPKWKYIKDHLPSLTDMVVMEIGSNCGFFSFEFARMGARQVYGIDVATKYVDNARWLQGVLGFDNITFFEGDFMKLDFDGETPVIGQHLLSNADTSIPLCNDKVDVIFMSTVLDHMFFPFFVLYKMIRMARRYVIVDVPIYHWSAQESAAHLAIEPTTGSHHGFVFTADFLANYIFRLGIKREAIEIKRYNEDHSMTIVIDTSQKSSALIGA